MGESEYARVYVVECETCRGRGFVVVDQGEPSAYLVYEGSDDCDHRWAASDG